MNLILIKAMIIVQHHFAAPDMQGRGQRQLQSFPDQRQLDRQAIAPPGQRPFGLHIGEHMEV